MNEAPDDLHYRLDQLRLLVTETTDPLAERLVRDMIAELEDRLRGADYTAQTCRRRTSFQWSVPTPDRCGFGHQRSRRQSCVEKKDAHGKSAGRGKKCVLQLPRPTRRAVERPPL